MSDVPMLAWSNQPILMFKAGFQPVVRNAHTWKMPKKATHASIKSAVWVTFFHIFVCVCCVFWFFWSASKTLHGLHTTGWKPAFILLLSRTSNVEGSGWVCWSMRSRLGVWTRVGLGRSARILGTVNRPIPAASCSTQYRYLMQVSSKRPCVLPPIPISCLVTMPLKIFVGNVCCLPMPQMKVRALYWSFRPLPRSCLLVQCNSSRLQAPAFQVCGSIPLSGHIFF